VLAVFHVPVPDQYWLAALADGSALYARITAASLAATVDGKCGMFIVMADLKDKPCMNHTADRFWQSTAAHF
jgi:hypothetical protein